VKYKGNVNGQVKRMGLVGAGLGILFKHFLLRLIEDAPKSHEKDSMLAKAAKYRCEDEERLINQAAPEARARETIHLGKIMRKVNLL
jgi:hypothetical protein